MKIRDDIDLGQHSHVGMARTANEDFFGYWEPDDDRTYDLKGRLVVVCDGMGGHTGGEIASRLAVKTVIEAYQSDPSDNVAEALRNSVEKANATVYGEGIRQPELKGMGTTVTALVQRRDMVYFGQVGDSRAYLIRGGQMKQMTKDHSLVQQLVDEGLLEASEMENHPDKNVILRSLGVKPQVDVDVSHIPVAASDTFLLCSDGLSGLVSDEKMNRIVSEGLQGGLSLRQVCERLVDEANAAGGHDNITVQLLRVKRTATATTDTTPQESITQSFTPDQVQASIEKARTEAAAKGKPVAPRTTPSTPAASVAATAPSMPVPSADEPPRAHSAGWGKLVFGLLLGLAAGGGAGFLLGSKAAVAAPGGAAGTFLAEARASAQRAGAPADALAAAAAHAERGDQAAAISAYVAAARDARRRAAEAAQGSAAADADKWGDTEDPLVRRARELLSQAQAAMQEERFEEARAHFLSASELFAAARGSE